MIADQKEASVMLTERQRLILSAIVDDYIRSAEPVGSRSISKRGDVGFSAATIRNEMSDLEDLGYLEQPHTSAGRIPSHKGYRYYVDHLLSDGTLADFELKILKGFFSEKIQEAENVIQQVSMIMSNLSNYTSIVLGPEVFSTTMKSFQIVPLNGHTAVAIIVTNTGYVENKMVNIPDTVSMSEIEKLVNILNVKLKNVPLVQLRTKLHSEVAAELQKYVDRYEDMIQFVEKMVDQNANDRIYLSGMTNMLTQPEFQDVEKIKSILDLFDETQTIVRLFTSMPEGIQVRIGTENSIEEMNNCSLITASYSLDEQPIGTIGIVGPTRMEYSRVIQMLDYLSSGLAVMYSRWYK